MNTAGRRRFADTDWVSSTNVAPLDQPPVPKGKRPPVERGNRMDAKFAMEDGCDVQDTQMSDSEFGTLFGPL